MNTIDLNTVDLEKPLWQLTTGEFLELIGKTPTVVENFMSTKERRFDYGIGGIARIFNCSMATANRIKQSGTISKAISQHGRMIVIDAELALDLMKKHNK